MALLHRWLGWILPGTAHNDHLLCVNSVHKNELQGLSAKEDFDELIDAVDKAGQRKRHGDIDEKESWHTNIKHRIVHILQGVGDHECQKNRINYDKQNACCCQHLRLC